MKIFSKLLTSEGLLNKTFEQDILRIKEIKNINNKNSF